jgi:hypothetical protein
MNCARKLWAKVDSFGTFKNHHHPNSKHTRRETSDGNQFIIITKTREERERERTMEWRRMTFDKSPSSERSERREDNDDGDVLSSLELHAVSSGSQ